MGGKRQLLEELVLRLPSAMTGYYEPFVGGGALFWHLHFAAGPGSAVYRGF
ncbi:MAG TPA: DNA adenine methylase [Paenalcaligenes sp.]|nr:DNA adenine methylase [Paenalcaligenes sp.]